MDNTPINQHLKNMSIKIQMETLTFEAEIDSIQYHTAEAAPNPVDKIKHIIRRCEEDEGGSE